MVTKKKAWKIRKCRRSLHWLAPMAVLLTVAGCATQQPTPVPFPLPLPLASTSQCNEQQQEIVRLQQMLADREHQIKHLIADQKNKDLEISKLKTHQQNQTKELKETTNQASRAEVKLRRFATEADVASRLVEVEMAMKTLESRLDTRHELPLQVLAHGLLDKASTAFKRGKYSVAADHAAQAEQLIEMMTEQQPTTESATPFKVAIPLKTKLNGQLRRKPDRNAAVIDKLQTATPVVARSYKAQWLQVQTENGNSGWIFSDFVEPR
ncbi:MAG TPA: hypothetical protein ENJ65_05055 [Candidatus Tenderia electrophaga]|uniref:SH3b domain-containing protein n=1 Tax=Candidatus Tenderia electrophaga TaxID=1748243 RepID=A0A832J5J6_9GAMM|nr:hypothetical protein [Candidatus Tenderia electrophaga]